MAYTQRGIETVLIANGASLSGGKMLGDRRIVAIAMPAAWTTAAITFDVSNDGTTWSGLNDPYGEVSISSTGAVAGKVIALDSGLSLALLCYDWLRVRSGTAAAAVNQGADRSIGLVTVPM